MSCLMFAGWFCETFVFVGYLITTMFVAFSDGFVLSSVHRVLPYAILFVAVGDSADPKNR